MHRPTSGSSRLIKFEAAVANRAPADGTIGSGDLLDRAEDHERWQLGRAHRPREVHLQEAGFGQRFGHGSRDAAQPLAFIAQSTDLRDEASSRDGHVRFGWHRRGR